MVNLLAGTLPRCGGASALRVLTPSLLYPVFNWARATEKRLVIVLRTSARQGIPDKRVLKLGLLQDAGVISSEMEDNPVWRHPEDRFWVTCAGEDHYVVVEKKGRGFPSIFKLRNLQSPGDSRVLLVHNDPPPGVFHCRTNSHWILYQCGGEPEFYIEPALLPASPIRSCLSSLLKFKQEDLGLLEGHIISLVLLSKREPHLALLISQKVNPTEHQILFWDVKKSMESKLFHEMERWLVTGIGLHGETILSALVIRSGSSGDELGDDAVVVAKSSMGRVYIIKRNSAPLLIQSAGSEVRNLFRVGNGTNFCVTYDGRYEIRDVNTPEEVLMTVDTTGFESVQWETNSGLMLATSEKRNVDPTDCTKSDTIQHIHVTNVEDNRSLCSLKLIQRWYADTTLVRVFSFSFPVCTSIPLVLGLIVAETTSSTSSSQRQLATKTKTPSSSSSSSSSIVVTSSQKNVNPPKSKKGRVDEEAEPRKPLVVGLTPTISTIAAAAVAERERASETGTNVPSLTASSSIQSEDPIGTQESLTSNTSECKSAALFDTTITPAANGVAETRMISASTGVPPGNFQVPRSVEPDIDGIFLREQMVSLLAGTLPRCGGASALRVLTPSLLYPVFDWARATEKRLVIMLRTATSQGSPDQRALKLGLWQGAGVISYEMEDNPILLHPEDNWWVTWAGEEGPEDWRVLLEHRDPPPGVFHCRTNSHWLLYYCGEPEFYIETALLPPPQIGGSRSSPLKVQQEDLGLLEGHVISFVTLSKREPHLALLISLKMSPTISPTEYQIIFWNVKKSLESKRLHEIERWPVTGTQALPHETISMAFVIRSGSSDYDLGDDAVVVAKSSTSRVYVIKRNSAVPHLVQSAGCEARNLFRIGNGTKFCVTYDGRYEVRDVNTPEEVLMTVDTTGFESVQWETNNGLMLATSEKRKVDPTDCTKSDTIQHIHVTNVEDNIPLFRLKLIQRWYNVGTLRPPSSGVSRSVPLATTPQQNP